ncbi:hypothetical protein LCGC14_2118730 [marine sediment metagenome]|uniref:Uncharacterized protein n=1 Tax=marine sediment metagenome TaxID=412755 RepID=A0A0F9ERZ3_9ZZZZ
MTTSDDAITKDQTALDAEQATQAPPAYVTVEDFNAMRTELTSQLRGLQGSVDRTASQVSQERADTDRQRRVNALEGQLQDADPATKVLLEDRIQEIRSTPTPQFHRNPWLHRTWTPWHSTGLFWSPLALILPCRESTGRKTYRVQPGKPHLLKVQ